MALRRNNFRSHGHARAQENPSILHQDFLSGRYSNIELGDIVRHVCEFARCRDGSEFIQLVLDETTEYRKISIFREMDPNLLALMFDRYVSICLP